MSEAFVWLEGSALAVLVRDSSSIWAYPTVLTLHTFGLMVLVGTSFVFDLRVLGVAPRVPLGPLQTLFPLMWAGFCANTVTGFLLFATDAVANAGSRLFLVKLACIAVGVATLVLLRRRVYADSDNPLNVSAAARLLAVASILAWAAALAAGRLLAYL